MEYSLVNAGLDESWDAFIDNSANGTIFSKSAYLKASQVNYKTFYCYKKEELRAAVAIIESADGKDIILDDLIVYNGVMYNKPTNKQNHAQQFSEQFKIQAFIAEELTKIYRNIEISLHASIVDIRAFLWVNYGDNKPQYTPDIRYTSYIDISDFQSSKSLEDISIYNKASTSRRQQIRYAIQKNYRTLHSRDSGQFIDFYNKTMQRQDMGVDTQKIAGMKCIIDSLLALEVGKIYACYDDRNELGSMAFFAWDTKRAYYVFGANDPAKRDGHSGTAVLWDAFYDMSNIGISEVDLEGVNSPQRGWFKLSFGGEIMPYYELKLSH